MTNKKFIFSIFMIIFVLLTLEASSFLMIHLTSGIRSFPIRRTAEIYHEQGIRIKKLIESNPSHNLVIDPVLGWRYRAGYNSPKYQINSQGLRSSREYSHNVEPGIIRIGVFGDSFVYCNETDNESSWPMQMERLYHNFEVLNYGVGGYGTDQAYLRYLQEGSELNPSIILIGFAPVNLRRVVNVYRRFITTNEWPLSKPRFILNDENKLTLLPNPLTNKSDYEKLLINPKGIRQLGKYDYWYSSLVYENPFYDMSATVRLSTTIWITLKRHYFDPNRLFVNNIFNIDAIAFKIQMGILEKFINEISKTKIIPIIIIFPDHESILHAKEGKEKIYDPLIRCLSEKRLRHIDLIGAFLPYLKTESIGDWFMKGGHYSPIANKHVATWLGKLLMETRGD